MSDEPNCGVGRKKLSLQECNKSVQYLKIQNTRKGAILRRKTASNGKILIINLGPWVFLKYIVGTAIGRLL
jgi:hypothetical protein